MPNDAQDFSFTAGGGLSPASFELDDDSDGTLPTAARSTDVVPGSGYSLSQSAAEPAGTSTPPRVTTAARCRTSTSAAGETVTCTFTNQQQGSIVVVKDAQPERPPGLLLHRGRRPLARRASSSTTTPTARCRTPALRGVSATAATRSPRRCRPAGSSSSATCDDGSPVSNIDVAPGENVTCTFTNRKRGADRGRQGREPERPAGLLVHGRRRPVAPRASRSTTTPNRTLSNTRTFANVAPGSGYSIVRERARAAGSRRARPATTAARCRTSTWRGRDRHLHVREPQARQDRGGQGRGARTTRRTSRSRPAAACSPSSFQLDDDSDGTLSNTRTFNDVTPGSGYSVAESLPSGWSQVSATCSDGSPDVEHRRAGGRDGHVHVREHARLSAAGGRNAARASMVARLRELRLPEPDPRPAARVPVLQPAGPDVGLPDRGDARRQPRAANMVGTCGSGGARQRRHPGRRGRRHDRDQRHRRAHDGGLERLHGRARGAGVPPDHRPPERAGAERGRDGHRHALLRLRCPAPPPRAPATWAPPAR